MFDFNLLHFRFVLIRVGLKPSHYLPFPIPGSYLKKFEILVLQDLLHMFVLLFFLHLPNLALHDALLAEQLGDLLVGLGERHLLLILVMLDTRQY